MKSLKREREEQIGLRMDRSWLKTFLQVQTKRKLRKMNKGNRISFKQKVRKNSNK